MADVNDRTIRDILSMSASDRKSAYTAKDIDKVIIDGNPFTDYGAFSFLWEKSYVKSPVRSGDGSIGNLNSYSTFITPHLKIDFSLMSIDSYRKLINLIYSKNEFTVTCYDVVANDTTTNKMYFTTEEMPKLWTIARALNGEEWVELLGVQDYTVEMVGTNVGFDVVDVLYYDENGTLIADATKSVDVGTEFIVGYDYVPESTSVRFDGQWRLNNAESGALYDNGDAIRATASYIKNNTIIFYAVTVPTNKYNLAFSYGNGIPLYKQSAASGESLQVNSAEITKGQTLGTAIANANITLSNGTIFSFPTYGTGSKRVQIDDKYYEPYEFKGWYWTSEENPATRVTADTIFDYDLNRIIYQVYAPKKYDVSYYTNTNGLISFDTTSVEYATTVPLPNMAMEGYTFIGWYSDSAFENQFSGSMPPKALDLYAKWEKNEE